MLVKILSNPNSLKLPGLIAPPELSFSTELELDLIFVLPGSDKLSSFW